jgi:hypothetical protein
LQPASRTGVDHVDRWFCRPVRLWENRKGVTIVTKSRLLIALLSAATVLSGVAAGFADGR